ncbi:MAG: alpha/beta hydrolase [bacterium]|nr:alpha/beta hydrolase [bacterium]
MKHEDGYFPGARGAKIFWQSWSPESTLRAVLLLVHGLGEHSGRYGNLVNHLVPKGYAVCALDHLGHGKSEGPRKHVTRFTDFTDTLAIFHARVREQHPEATIFLVGHSMGGLISATYLLDHQADLAGAVLSGPAVKIPEGISPVTIAVGKTLSAIAPRFGLLPLDADGVSRDPEVVRAYVDDPLVYTGKTTARLAAEILAAMQRIAREAHVVTLPILLLQGTADRLVDPASARMLHDLVSSTDKALEEYEGLYHEVYNEPEHPRVLSDVETWLDARLAS